MPVCLGTPLGKSHEEILLNSNYCPLCAANKRIAELEEQLRKSDVARVIEQNMIDQLRERLEEEGERSA